MPLPGRLWAVCQDFIVSPLILRRAHTTHAFLFFTGANNSAKALPEYCPPTALCGASRLSGGNCPPQGWYEPTLCDAGFYCPLGGKEHIPCEYFPAFVLPLQILLYLQLRPKTFRVLELQCTDILSAMEDSLSYLFYADSSLLR